MKNLNLLALVITAGLVVGCSKDSSTKAVDKDGNCTSETIEAYNDVGTKAISILYRSNRSDVQAVQNACSRFKSLIGGQICKATDLTTFATTNVDRTSRDTVCNEADRQMTALNNQNNSSTGNSGNNGGTAYDSFYCSDDQTVAYADVYAKTYLLKTTSSEEELTAAENSCNSFKTKMGSKSCYTRSTFTSLNSGSLAAECASIQTIRTKQGNQVLATVTSGLKVTVANAAALMPTDVSLYAYQKGNSFEYGVSNSALDTTKPYCLFVSTKVDSKKEGATLLLNKITATSSPDMLKITADLDDKGFSEITCYAGAEKTSKTLTLSDVKSAFQGVLKIEVLAP